jgi:hypothetical protein
MGVSGAWGAVTHATGAWATQLESMRDALMEPLLVLMGWSLIVVVALSLLLALVALVMSRRNRRSLRSAAGPDGRAALEVTGHGRSARALAFALVAFVGVWPLSSIVLSWMGAWDFFLGALAAEALCVAALLALFAVVRDVVIRWRMPGDAGLAAFLAMVVALPMLLVFWVGMAIV